MKKIALMMLVLGTLFTAKVFAQEATVAVTLNPMGDFKATTTEVVGSATSKGDQVSAQNIVVHLKNLKTGMALRDTHTQKYLQTSQFPDAVLVSATGKNGKGEGKVRIRGIEKEIKGTYKIAGKFLHADFPLTLSDFGIKDVNYMNVGVEDQIQLHVVIPLKAAP